MKTSFDFSKMDQLPEVEISDLETLRVYIGQKIRFEQEGVPTKAGWVLHANEREATVQMPFKELCQITEDNFKNGLKGFPIREIKASLEEEII